MTPERPKMTAAITYISKGAINMKIFVLGLIKTLNFENHIVS